MECREKEDIPDLEEEFLVLKNVMNHLGRGRKRTTDTRQFLQMVNLFKILQPLKSKPLPVIRSFIKDVNKHLFNDGQHIDVNTFSHTLQYTWLVVQGKVLISNHSPAGNNEQSITLSEGDCFSSHVCHFRQFLNQPQHYQQFSVRAKSFCILFRIENTKLNKIFQIDEVQQQLQKRTLICRALNLHTAGHSVKSFIKKFGFKKVNKSTILIQQNYKEDTFFIISNGDVEITQNCINSNGQKVKLRLGIVTENSFINGSSFFKQPEVTVSEYTVESMTEVELFLLSKQQLFKYFYDLPILQHNISSICNQKHLLRQQHINKFLQKSEIIQNQDSSCNIVCPLFKKSTNGFRKQIPSGNQDFIMDSIKYQQLVLSKQKVVKPLMERKQNSNSKRSCQLNSGQLKKIIKKEKMDIMKVKSLVDNRIRGIRSNDVTIKLKPTLFNDRVLDQIQQIEIQANPTPSVLSPRLRIKQPKSNDLTRHSTSDMKYMVDTCKKVRAFTAKIQRPKSFRMVSPKREHFESYIHKSSNPYVLTRCTTGKFRKVRAIV